MPMLKTIAGHTSARGIRRYLTKKNRALAEDLINIDAPEGADAFDWAAVMDETRRAFGNDLPWRGRRVRTYKHYVVSPDPKDGISLESLRDLASSWADVYCQALADKIGVMISTLSAFCVPTAFPTSEICQA